MTEDSIIQNYEELDAYVTEMSRGCNSMFYTVVMPSLIAVVIVAGVLVQAVIQS